MLGRPICLSTSILVDSGDTDLCDVFTSMADRVQKEVERIVEEEPDWFVPPKGWPITELPRMIEVLQSGQDPNTLFESSAFLKTVSFQTDVPPWFPALHSIDQHEVIHNSPTLGVSCDRNNPEKTFFVRLPPGAPLSHIGYALQDLTKCIAFPMCISIDWSDVLAVSDGGIFIYHCYEFNTVDRDMISVKNDIFKMLHGKGNTLYVLSVPKAFEDLFLSAIPNICDAVANSLKDDASCVFTVTFPTGQDPYCRISFYVRQ